MLANTNIELPNYHSQETAEMSNMDRSFFVLRWEQFIPMIRTNTRQQNLTIISTKFWKTILNILSIDPTISIAQSGSDTERMIIEQTLSRESDILTIITNLTINSIRESKSCSKHLFLLVLPFYYLLSALSRGFLEEKFFEHKWLVDQYLRQTGAARLVLSALGARLYDHFIR
jgi:hypothetical protein